LLFLEFITHKSIGKCYKILIEIIIALGLICILSLVNYKIVEVYFLKRTNYIFIFLSFLLLSAGAIFLSVSKNSNEFSNKLYSYTVEINKYTATLNNNSCHDISSVDEICSFNSDKNKKVILLGDSHARELGYLLSEKLENYNFEIITGNSCLFVFDKEYFEGCPLKSNNKSIKDYVSSQSNAIFIYSGDIWDPGYDYLELELNIPRTIYLLLKNQNYLIAIDQIPTFPFNPIQNITSAQFKNYIGIDYSYWKDEKLNNKQLSVYDNINSDRYYLISPEEKICNDLIQDTCVAAIDDLLFYRDDNHLTIDGVNLFIDRIIYILDLINNS